MDIVVLHRVNDTTKVVQLSSPKLMSQLTEAGIVVTLQDEDGRETGFAQFHSSGLVALGMSAIGQYPRTGDTTP